MYYSFIPFCGKWSRFLHRTPNSRCSDDYFVNFALVFLYSITSSISNKPPVKGQKIRLIHEGVSTDLSPRSIEVFYSAAIVVAQESPNINFLEMEVIKLMAVLKQKEAKEDDPAPKNTWAKWRLGAVIRVVVLTGHKDDHFVKKQWVKVVILVLSYSTFYLSLVSCFNRTMITYGDADDFLGFGRDIGMCSNKKMSVRV
uniref:Uncharacterized protein n=1 Tax=Lactuca sativa TaxID=4236 RepID=A0A9R1VJX7_LACSA|nr:hypothetical protein LSAT_V11C500285510 [Lactuca sativa]